MSHLCRSPLWYALLLLVPAIASAEPRTLYKAADVANAVLFLASDASAMITGTVELFFKIPMRKFRSASSALARRLMVWAYKAAFFFSSALKLRNNELAVFTNCALRFTAFDHCLILLRYSSFISFTISLEYQSDTPTMTRAMTIR